MTSDRRARLAAAGAAVLLIVGLNVLVRRFGAPELPDLPDFPELPGWLHFLVTKGKLILIAIVLALAAVGEIERRRRRGGSAGA